MSHLSILITGSLAAAACALMGCFLLLRKLAMLGDAIGHSILFGVAVSFCLSGGNSTWAMLIGATLCGWLTGWVIELMRRRGVQNDAAVSVAFTTPFAAGVILISLFAQYIDLDLNCALFGEILYTPFDTLLVGSWHVPRAMVLMLSVFLIGLVVILCCYRPLRVSTFDPLLAASLGFPVALLNQVLMGLISLTSVAAFESVGAVLVVSMLIVPAATAHLLTRTLASMLFVSAGIGVLSTCMGYAVAFYWDTSISGSMAMSAGFCFLVALAFSPRHGLVGRLLRSQRMKVKSV